MSHDPRDIDYALRTLMLRQEKAIRMRYGIGCEREHAVWEMAQEYERSSRQIHRYLKSGMASLRSLLGENAAEDLRSISGLSVLIRVPGPKEQLKICSALARLFEDGSPDRYKLLALSPRQFEELIAEIWDRLGYSVELTARTRDGGRDVIAIQRAEARVRYLIECKRYDPVCKVGVRFVRALYGVKCDEGATKAVLATTSSFTRGALRFFGRHEWDLEPRDYQGILEWIRLAQKHPRDQKSGRWGPYIAEI